MFEQYITWVFFTLTAFNSHIKNYIISVELSWNHTLITWEIVPNWGFPPVNLATMPVLNCTYRLSGEPLHVQVYVLLPQPLHLALSTWQPGLNCSEYSHLVIQNYFQLSVDFVLNVLKNKEVPYSFKNYSRWVKNGVSPTSPSVTRSLEARIRSRLSSSRLAQSILQLTFRNKGYKLWRNVTHYQPN